MDIGTKKMITRLMTTCLVKFCGFLVCALYCVDDYMIKLDLSIGQEHPYKLEFVTKVKKGP